MSKISESKIKELKVKILSLLRSDETYGSITLACKKANVSRPTVNKWREADSDFGQAVTEAMEEGGELLADLAESQLAKRIMEGDTTAIIFTLKTRRRYIYGEKVQDAQSSVSKTENVETHSISKNYETMLIRLSLKLLKSENLLTPEQEDIMKNAIFSLEERSEGKNNL